jgi:hypothetical protein
MPITMKTPRKVGTLASLNPPNFHDHDLAELNATRDFGRVGLTSTEVPERNKKALLLADGMDSGQAGSAATFHDTEVI